MACGLDQVGPEHGADANLPGCRGAMRACQDAAGWRLVGTRSRAAGTAACGAGILPSPAMFAAFGRGFPAPHPRRKAMAVAGTSV